MRWYKPIFQCLFFFFFGFVCILKLFEYQRYYPGTQDGERWRNEIHLKKEKIIATPSTNRLLFIFLCFKFFSFIFVLNKTFGNQWDNVTNLITPLLSTFLPTINVFFALFASIEDWENEENGTWKMPGPLTSSSSSDESGKEGENGYKNWYSVHTNWAAADAENIFLLFRSWFRQSFCLWKLSRFPFFSSPPHYYYYYYCGI